MDKKNQKRHTPFQISARNGELCAKRPARRRSGAAPLDGTQNPSPRRARAVNSATEPTSPRGSWYIPKAAVLSPDGIFVEQISDLAEMWLQDGILQLHSKRTGEERRRMIKRLIEFLEGRKSVMCGGAELKEFFVDPRHATTNKPLSVSSNETFRRAYRAFWNWLIRNEHVARNAMDAVPDIPLAKRRAAEVVQPFGEDQCNKILQEAAKSPYPVRDTALVFLILDTGMRAGELCKIQLEHMDMGQRTIKVSGKGGKNRTVRFSPETAVKLGAWMRERNVTPKNNPGEYLFVGVAGHSAGQPHTSNGIYQAFSKIVIRCGITDGKRGPHRGRHSCATLMMRNGARQDAVQQQLGHSTAKMTQHYIQLVEADVFGTHDRCSPITRRKKGKAE